MKLSTVGRLGVIALTLMVQAVGAQERDNDVLRGRQLGILATHNVAVGAGLVSTGPFGIAVELTEFSANLGLKALPPVLEVPGSVTRYPDMSINGSYGCGFSFSLPQASAVYEDLLGFGPIRRLPTDWGILGSPRVEHKNSAVQLSLAGATAGPQFLDEGDHRLTWLAETQLSPFWDVYFPSFQLGFGIMSETKNGSTFTKTAGGKFSERGAREARENSDLLKRVAVRLGKRAALTGAEQVNRDTPGFLGDEIVSARHSRVQEFRVWDVHPPVFTDPDTGAVIEGQSVAIEASDFGGARFNRIKTSLAKRFEYSDACGRRVTLRAIDPPSLIEIGGTGVDIVWQIEDAGVYNAADPRFPVEANHSFDGTALTTRLVQRVIVADTQPPLLLPPDSFARYTETDLVLNGDRSLLGKYSVVDLADPNPVVVDDAPDVLPAPPVDGGHRFRIRWEASDETGNVTAAPPDNPDQYTQTVTLKWPGSNTAPVAPDPGRTPPGPASTVSGEPVSILLTGLDTDLLPVFGSGGADERVDPLVFNIVDQPANGEFVAPLYPYFIEDFRAKPVETPRNMDPNTLACPTGDDLQDGRFLDSQLGLLDVQDHGGYIQRCYCEGAGVQPPRNFIYQPDYIHIDDADRYFVTDNPYFCDDLSTTSPFANQEARIASWEDGALIDEIGTYYDQNDYRIFDVDREGRLWYYAVNGQEMTVKTVDRDFERWYLAPTLPQPSLTQVNLTVSYSSSPVSNRIAVESLTNAHADPENRLIYVSDKVNVWVFSLEGDRQRMSLGDLVSLTGFNGLAANNLCHTLPGVAGSAVDGIGFTMTTDSHGNLFVADSCEHKIHKFSPSTLSLDGTFHPGDYVGWLGACSGNRPDPDTGVEFNNCIVADGHSNGFTCTDETCVDGASGSGPGQFNVISHINIDPNDTLYVVDVNNSRVQRFGADGVFAGEARSVGNGITNDSSFVLGNMGRPKHVSVNSESFHVLESRSSVGDFFLHIFKTLPFTDVTSDSARVEYVPGIGFRGDDQFSYLVDDGIEKSVPAVVSINVGANQRPPENLHANCFADDQFTLETPCSVPEDEVLYVRLSASDPDGFVGFGGYDTHTITLLSAPQNGEFELLATNANNAEYRYTPDQDYNGGDSVIFQAFDGTDSAAEPGEQEFVVVPVPDDVVITVPVDLQIPRGFEQAYQFEFDDPDRDPSAELVAHSVDWGDGVAATASMNWVNIGIYDDNGQPMDPQRDGLPGNGFLVGAHTYVDPTIGFSVCMTDSGKTVCADEQGSSALNLVDVTRVGVARADQDALQPDTDFSLFINVTNEQPAGWSGFQADNTTLRIEPPGNLTVAGVPAECAPETIIVCDLGSLAVGETRQLELVVRVDLATARTTTLFDFSTEQTDAGPRLDDITYSSFTVEVSDRDGDGVIDSDDAFPDDARYVADSDSDGIADGYEDQFGLDSLDASDATRDDDGDGFDNGREFEFDGSPFLTDAFLPGPTVASGAEGLTASDRFGFSLASGDIDADGLEDVAIGAPTFNGNGAVFVQLSANGLETAALQRIDAADNGLGAFTNFGRSVAMGDLDNNGLADLVVGSSNEVSIYLATVSGLPSAPDRIIAGGAGDNLGFAVHVADLDDDNVDDLIISAPYRGSLFGQQGAVDVYRASSDWLTNGAAAPAKTFIGPQLEVFRLGASLSVGDIDNDDRADLLVGSVNGNGQVYVYRGSTRDWNLSTRTTPDFIITGEAAADQFGFSIAADADIDADGIDDLLVGAYGYGSGNVGATYVYASRDAYWIQLDPAYSDRVTGEKDGDQFGVRVSMLDPSGSKVGADVIVGANRFEQGQTPDEGALYHYDGGSLPLSAPQAEYNNNGRDMLGYFVLGTGDIDGDGRSDFVAGAPDIDIDEYKGDGGFVRYYFGGGGEVQADSDGDRVADSLDNCPATSNTNQSDMDGDGDGDACDADIDGDGISNDLDNCPLVASLDVSDLDDDGQGDVCDDDDDGDGVEDAEDVFPRDARYSADTDADGMPDSYETQFGLDPNDATDAQQDLDGDGRTNREEFEMGSDITADDVAPVLSVPGNIVVDSIGPLTPVNLGTAQAIDAKDGELTPDVDARSPFEPGRHVITWSAVDAAGNTSSDTQTVDVIPRANFSGTSISTGEGQPVNAGIFLNGFAAEYPVTIDFTIGGTATNGDDYTVVPSQVVLAQGSAFLLEIPTTSDAAAEGDETLILTLAAAENAVVGGNNVLTVTISEDNLPPQATISALQGLSQVSTVARDGGLVDLFAQVSDPNGTSDFVYDWSTTDSWLLPLTGVDGEQFTFDPSIVPVGLYRVAVTVTDTGTPALSDTAHRFLRVTESQAVLEGNVDSDGDGANDAAEGAGDSNDNGVSEYLDPADDYDNRLVARTGTNALIQVPDGLELRLGAAAMASGEDATVSMADLAQYGDDGGPSSHGDDVRFRYPGGIFDFEITNVDASNNVATIVIPQADAIPAAASYRKFVAGTGWQDFVINTNNSVASAPGEPDICPAPGSEVYISGLTEGDYCVQLTIEDGGPNDVDGQADGVIRDPGGVAIEAVEVAADASAIGVNNKSVNAGAVDVVLLRFNIDVNSPDIVLGNITLDASGSGNDSTDIATVKLWVDANADGAIDAGDMLAGQGSFVADNGTLQLQLTTPYMLPMGATSFMVSYDFQ